ncbi:hypothetical protein NNJEOMEG_01364 [Fundidesulfovibrio magnetotacticus]|uniref:Xylose isomerase-like TIM barrel domain-containing protein n=1 Tax=Fundidesulfovibrio magnetotacticus TaxID=2730080 RepID=A0A6V8LRD0_9BACT|nr:cobamide remodeling phosphodiesterase CbiR [Fundidesulfovibrio magnetotacticus]GFK93530.1 hypothetical protein NNJEOMEG_01364 [Fundidesulfovibrio magnetotacticus]
MTPSQRPLAATSWLAPTTLRRNLERIAAWDLPIHQAALLFYQHAPSLAYAPSEFHVRGLETHVHLPTDLPWEQGPGPCWDLCARLMDLAAPLAPWAGVLHPPGDPALLEDFAARWRKASPGWRLLVENIPSDGLEAHWPVIEALDLSLCLDNGHLMAFGQHHLLQRPGLARRVELLHCYAPGPEAGRHRHLGLQLLTPEQRALLGEILDLLDPNTTILFEVFTEEDLRASLETFYALDAERRPRG